MNDESPAYGRAPADARNVEDNDTPTKGQHGVLTVRQRSRWSPLTVDGMLARPAVTAQAHDLAMAIGKVMRRDGSFRDLRHPDDGLCVEVTPFHRNKVLSMLGLSAWSWGDYVRRWEAARIAHRCADLRRGSVRLLLEPAWTCPVPWCREPLPTATDDRDPDVVQSNDERRSEQRSTLPAPTEIVLIRGDASRDEEGDASPPRSDPEVPERLARRQGLSKSARRGNVSPVRAGRCAECHAASAEPGYQGHAMHCRSFRSWS